MTSRRNTPMPLARQEYEYENEAIFRRTLEFTFQTVENDIQLAKTQGDKDGSLAMRRFQFLLMGAS